MITIRIDPIIPGVTSSKDIEQIIKRSSEIGIKNIRFSIMDSPDRAYYLQTISYMHIVGNIHLFYEDFFRFIEK